MEKETFLKILTEKEGTQLFEFISAFGKDADLIQIYLDQYEPKKHAILTDKTKRPDKIISVPTNRRNAEGYLIRYPDDNSPEVEPKTVYVTRVAIALQQEVTESAAAILCTNKVELVTKQGDVADLQEIFDDNKLQFKNLELCRIWLSETEVAELWYKNDDDELKSLTLANSYGNLMFPVFDDKGKMICFARTYTSQDWNQQNNELEDVKFCEIFTDTDVTVGSAKEGEEWQFELPKKHGFAKIPVSYASRQYPIWYNVQDAIERTETTISNLCDTNDYFGSPMLILSGSVQSVSAKGEPGKMLELEVGAKAEYLTWQQAPESIKLELDKLAKIISDDTAYINLSPENLKGLFGSAPSTYAIKLLFTPAHEKAAKHEEVFGEFIQRRINLLLSELGNEKTKITPKFTYFLPRNDQEEIQNINTAKTGGFLSQESAVTDSPLTVNKDKELAALGKDEAKAAGKSITVPNPVLQ